MRSVGDLCTLVSTEGPLRWKTVLQPNICHIVKCVVSGVKYLHNNGIQHYDLKGTQWTTLSAYPYHSENSRWQSHNTLKFWKVQPISNLEESLPVPAKTANDRATEVSSLKN